MPIVSSRRSRSIAKKSAASRQGLFGFADEPSVAPVQAVAETNLPDLPKPKRVYPGRKRELTDDERRSFLPGDDDLERWLPIRDWPHYEVSDWGRVRSYRRRGGINRHGQIVYATPILIGGYVKRSGHIDVCLYRNDGREKRRCCVHTLVLEAFVGPRPLDMDVCHNDGNPANNRLSNLRWDTRKSNKHDMLKHGNGPNKLTENDIRTIWSRLITGDRDHVVAKDFRVTQAVITGIKAGDHWSHITSSLPGFPIVTDMRAASNANRQPIYPLKKYTDSRDEIWKEVPEYPAYRVSTFGRMRSCWTRAGLWGKQQISDDWKLINPALTKFGHRRMLLYREGCKRKSESLHTIVLTAFAGPRPKGMVACHIDGDPGNNHASNLRWDTQKSNVRDRYLHAKTISQEK